jgi:hypothetical protein
VWWCTQCSRRGTIKLTRKSIWCGQNVFWYFKNNIYRNFTTNFSQWMIKWKKNIMGKIDKQKKNEVTTYRKNFKMFEDVRW